jgi:hypothetical protein
LCSDYIPVIHARKHVLVVDDIEMNREIMGDLLSEDYDISGTKKRTDFNLGHDGNEISLILFAT